VTFQLAPEVINQNSNRSVSDEEIIWEGSYKDVAYKWTTKDFYIKHQSGKEEKLLTPYVKDTFTERVNVGDKSSKCKRYFRFNILSVVGTIISIKMDAFSACDYADSEEKLITVDIGKSGDFYDTSSGEIDLSKSSRVVKLTELYTDEELFQALIVLPEIQRTLEFADKNKNPQNLPELLTAIDSVGVDGIDNTGHKLTNISWSSFAFYKVTDGKVTIEVELQPSTSSPSHPHLALQLPISPKLKEIIESANTRQLGFLAEDIQSITKGQKTEIIVPFVP
jgi:hypothetical protein